jgi:hypothetical protein
MLKAWNSTREKRNIHAGETGVSIYTEALNTVKYIMPEEQHHDEMYWWDIIQCRKPTAKMIRYKWE